MMSGSTRQTIVTVLFLWSACLAPLSMAAQKQPEEYQQRLVDWLLEDPTSFFHPSIRFRRLGPDGESGPYAYHATEDIPKGTPLIVLPRKYVIESHQPVEIGRNPGPRDCVTVQKMLEEYEKVKNSKKDPSTPSSFYEPYLSYLFDDTVGGTSRGLLPTTWSPESKEILELILEPQGDYYTLEPEIFEHPFVSTYCPENKLFQFSILQDDGSDDNDDDDEDDDLYTEKELDELIETIKVQDAFLFLKSRGWDDKLLPLVDMFNHRNGPQRNVEVTSVHDGGGDIAAYTTRDVAAGEQLQYTYSECFDSTCAYSAVMYNYGSQPILADYGFVELYPQRWYLGGADDDVVAPEADDDDYSTVVDDGKVQDLTVEVTTDENDDSKIVLRWIFRTPNTASLQWIKEQLDRLKLIEAEVTRRVEGLGTIYEKGHPITDLYNLEHEGETLLDYHRAYVQVLELALKHADDPVAVTAENHRDHMVELRRTVTQWTVDELRKHELLSSSSSRNGADEL